MPKTAYSLVALLVLFVAFLTVPAFSADNNSKADADKLDPQLAEALCSHLVDPGSSDLLRR